jgi:hypothetical protein
MSKQKSLAQLQAAVDKFNSTFKEGDKLKLKDDDGNIKEVTVFADAQVLGGHSAVGWFLEINGCYSLDRVIY